MRFALVCAVALAVCCFLGCGDQQSYEGPQRVPVTGKVTLDGQPVHEGIMNLKAVGDGRAANAEILNGTYQIEEAVGPNPGEYEVSIYWHKPIEGATSRNPEEPDDIPTEQIIPAKYNKATELTVTFTEEGENVHDFELTTP